MLTSNIYIYNVICCQQEAGAFSCVVECVPSEVGSAITEALKIPTIGIGAGPYTGGQV